MQPEANNSDHSPLILVIRVFLAFALVIALFYSGWKIYQRLPASPAAESVFTESRTGTSLRIAIKNQVANAQLNSPVELYRFDLAAARKEFEESPRLARQFDDFLLRRMHDVQPVKAEVNGNGSAAANLEAGSWWLHATATLDTGETVEWRLPLVVDRDQMIDLSIENAYERTKKF